MAETALTSYTTRLDVICHRRIEKSGIQKNRGLCRHVRQGPGHSNSVSGAANEPSANVPIHTSQGWQGRDLAWRLARCPRPLR